MSEVDLLDTTVSPDPRCPFMASNDSLRKESEQRLRKSSDVACVGAELGMSFSGSSDDEFAAFGRPPADGDDRGIDSPTDLDQATERGDNSAAGLLVGDVDHRTRLLRLLSSGSFGEVYIGELEETERRVAVKVERQGSGTGEQLLYEGNIYRRLENGPGIATLHWFGMHPAGLNVMVLNLLGPSLYDLLVRSGGRLSLKSVLLLLDQLFHTIEFVHESGFAHRDISPNNLLMGRPGSDDAHRLYLVDFGLSKQYCNGPRFMPAGRRHIRYARPVVGTMRFASLHAHAGDEVGRRDDLEAIGYLAVYLLRGRLPWQGLQADTAVEKFNAIARTKASTSAEQLCEDLPNEFSIYVNYTRQLKLYDVPDYDSIRTMFRELAGRLHYQYDDQFDWQANTQVVSGMKCRTPSGDSGIADMAEDVC